MHKKSFTLRMAGVAGLSGLLGLGASNMALAVDFDAEATVQNALAVTNVADMNLGTVFATTSSTTATSIMRLSASLGTMANVASDAGPFIPLGGHIRAQGQVTIGTDAPFDIILPDAQVQGTGAVANQTGWLIGTDGGGPLTMASGTAVTLAHSSGNPNVANIRLVNFRAAIIGGAPAGTLACPEDPGSVDANICTATPAFGVTEVNFNIGADVLSDNSALATQGYQEGVYSGTFEVTATY